MKLPEEQLNPKSIFDVLKPLDDALEVGDQFCAERLMLSVRDVNEKGNSWRGGTALHNASGFKQQVAIAELLLLSGADINARDKQGQTPLHEAAESGAIMLVKLLVTKGATIDAQANSGETPLIRCLKQYVNTESRYPKLLEVAQYLIDHGADVNVKEPITKRTWYYLAKSGGGTELPAVLSRFGGHEGKYEETME